MHTSEPGLFIGGIGLPGSGKTSVFKALHQQLKGSKLFVEPEENTWPLALKRKELVHRATYISGFRLLREPLFTLAHECREQGKWALVDSCLDMIFAEVLNKPEAQCFLPHSAPYRDLFIQIAQLDWDLLPKPDVLVTFNIDFETWKQCVQKRDRKMDRERDFEGTYPVLARMFDAARKFSEEKGVRLLEIHQKANNPEHSVRQIMDQLNALKLSLKRAES